MVTIPNLDHIIIAHRYCRSDSFSYLIFPYTIVKWDKPYYTSDISKSCNVFNSFLLKISRSVPKSTYHIWNPMELKLLTCLKLGPSHLNKLWFNHNFEDCINSSEFESKMHFFQPCHCFANIRNTHTNKLISK